MATRFLFSVLCGDLPELLLQELVFVLHNGTLGQTTEKVIIYTMEHTNHHFDLFDVTAANEMKF